MKVTASTVDLCRALKIAAKVVPARPAVESERMLTITPMGEIIKISARASGRTAVIKIPGEGEGDAVSVDARIISEISQKLAGGTVKLETTNAYLVITSGTSRTRLAFVEPTGMQDAQGEQIAKLTAGELLEGIRRTLYAVCEDSQRIALTGISFKHKGDEIELFALDGFRLSLTHIRPETTDWKRDIIVPRDGVRLIADALKDYQSTETVTIYLRNTELQVECKDVLIKVILINAEYIEYEKIINRDAGSVQTMVSVDEMRSALSRASVAVGKTGLVKLEIHSDYLTIMANDGETVDISEGVFCESTGEMSIAFNARYVIEMLDNAKAEEVTLDLVSPLTIAIIHDGENLAGILPVRVAQ